MQIKKLTLDSVWKVLWLFTTFGLLLGAGVFVLKFYEDSMRTRERGRLVESIVREQLNSLVTQSEATFRETTSGLPREKSSKELERWVISRILAGTRNFHQLTSLLRSLSHDHSVPAPLQTSVGRWANTSENWGNTPTRNSIGMNGLSADQLLVEGRQRFFEASGFQKIDRSYDAAVLNLWTIAILSEFVQKHPFHREIPEVLYMLGESYLDLGKGLPPQVKADRVLNLCSELYPDSVWANRANSIWKEQFSMDDRSGADKYGADKYGADKSGDDGSGRKLNHAI